MFINQILHTHPTTLNWMVCNGKEVQVRTNENSGKITSCVLKNGGLCHVRKDRLNVLCLIGQRLLGEKPRCPTPIVAETAKYYVTLEAAKSLNVGTENND